MEGIEHGQRQDGKGSVFECQHDGNTIKAKGQQKWLTSKVQLVN